MCMDSGPLPSGSLKLTQIILLHRFGCLDQQWKACSASTSIMLGEIGFSKSVAQLNPGVSRLASYYWQTGRMNFYV